MSDDRYRWVILKNSDIQRIDVGYMSVPPPAATPLSRSRTAALWTKRHMRPRRRTTTPSVHMVGKARYGCNANIDSVTAIVKIQKKVRSSWVDVARGQQTTNRPTANKQYTVQATMGCQRGTFRTASQGYGYFKGVRSQSTAWDYSQTVTNPCK